MLQVAIAVEQSTIDTVGERRVRGLLGSLRALCYMASRRLWRRRLIVHVHVSQGGSFLREGALARAAKAMGFRVVTHVHGSSFCAFARNRPGLVGWALRRSDMVLVLTEEAGRSASALAPASQVARVINAVAPARDDAGARERLVVFAGAVGKRKGVDVLLDAWERIPAAQQGWRLMLCGPLDDQLLVSEARLPEGVEWLGTLSPSEVWDLMGRAKVAVLPSRAEALPMFLLEAMAHGLVPVATHVGAVAELVASSGWTVAADDAAALATALDEAVGMSEPEFEGRSAAARRTVRESYSLQRLADQIQLAWFPHSPDGDEPR